MKKSLQLAMLCVALAAFAASVCAQKKPLVGGYKEASVEDATIVEAADFAVGEQSRKADVSLEVVRIERAERQTVQGANFRLCIEVKTVEEEDADETQFVLAVVYQNLKKEFALTSWKADGCGKKE